MSFVLASSFCHRPLFANTPVLTSSMAMNTDSKWQVRLVPRGVDYQTELDFGDRWARLGPVGNKRVNSCAYSSHRDAFFVTVRTCVAYKVNLEITLYDQSVAWCWE